MSPSRSMTPEELHRALEQLRQDPTLESVARAAEVVVQDLQVHQAELEMQNQELREAHQALEDSRNRFADLFDFAPVGYLTFDRSGVVIEANLTAAALLGLERGKLVGKPFTAISHIVDTRAFREHIARVFGSESRAGYDAVFKSQFGRAITLELTSVRSRDAYGKLLDQCRTTMTDVTERRWNHAMLRLLADASTTLSSSLDYSTTIASVAELTVPTLADACIFDVIEEGGRLRRLPIVSSEPNLRELVQLLERPLLVLRPESPQAKVMEVHESMLLVGDTSAHAVPAELAHACGAPSSALVVPLMARGTCRGVLTLLMLGSRRVATVADRSVADDLASRAAMAIDNARLYEEAHRAIRAREEILSTVSHDLRNSLSSIAMNVTLMQSSAPAQERRRDQRRIEMLRRSAQHMKRLTDDLVDLCSIEAGQLAIDCGAWDVDAILGEAMELHSPLTRERGQHLEIRTIGKTTLATCDRDRVLQILGNLVGNAMKYTPDGGHITVKAERFDDAVRFCVTDDGPGIDERSLKHLFDRYWRVENRRSGKKGLGLGLDICKGLVESHGGAIWAESTPGRGSSFYFTLPIGEQAPRPTPSGTKPTVLVVDDEADVRNVIVEALENKGCKVFAAADGAEALVLLRGDLEVDLPLVDLEMPNVGGRELAERLLTDPSIRPAPIVLMSSGRMSDGEAEQLGAEAFLQKPFDVRALFELVPLVPCKQAHHVMS